MNIKNFVTFSLIFVIIFLAYIFGFRAGEKDSESIRDDNIALLPTAPISSPMALSYDATSLTLQEVSRHNIQEDCWLVIDRRVYNVTSFISSHPGGIDAIVRNCGTDATQAFNTKGKMDGSTHSEQARALLTSYYIGPLIQ